MNTYKIEKEGISYLKKFISLEEATQTVSQILGTGWTITLSDENIFESTPEQQLDNDINFGKSLIQQFLLDNRSLGDIPVADQLSQLEKFKDINTLLNVGAIRASHSLINALQTDQYLTQQRKDNYLSKISEYLVNNYGTV
jgi:hypothetical protein